MDFSRCLQIDKLRDLQNNYLPSGHQATSMSSEGPDWSTVYVAGSQAPVSNKGTATTTQNIGWVGAQPKGLAVINSTEAYVARTDEGEICSVYLDNASVKSCFDVGGRPVGLVLNSDKTKLYFIDSDSNKVRRVVTSTGSVSDLVTLSSKPTAMALNKAETQLFVTSDIADVVYRVSTTGGSILSTISVPGGPEGIAIEADGQTMWISQSEYGSVVRAGFAAVANQALDSLTNTTTISVGNHPASSVLSADGNYLIVANIDDGTLSRIDTQTLKVTLVMQVGAEPNAIALDEQKNVAIVAYRFGNSIGQVSLPAIPVPPAVVPVVEPVTTVAPVTTTVAPVATTEAPVTVVSTLPPLTYSTQASAKISVAPALSLKKPVTNKSIVTYSKTRSGENFKGRSQSCSGFCKVLQNGRNFSQSIEGWVLQSDCDCYAQKRQANNEDRNAKSYEVVTSPTATSQTNPRLRETRLRLIAIPCLRAFHALTVPDLFVTPRNSDRVDS
jgi:YVTN family beta-propeller protein